MKEYKDYYKKCPYRTTGELRKWYSKRFDSPAVKRNGKPMQYKQLYWIFMNIEQFENRR